MYRRAICVAFSAVVIGLTIGRCPELLLHPRFFAEEGTTYFSSAYRTSFLANIFSAHYGYYTFYNQLATSLATLVPLDQAPLVTTLMALLVQVGVSVYVLWGDLPLATLPRRCALAVALPLIAWPGHWLTIIGSQCWLGAGAFLLLISGANGGFRARLARGGYLLLAGLTGVVSCFLAPAYLLRGFRQRSREFLLYGALLAACLPVHALVLLRALRSRSAELSCRFIDTDFCAMIGKTLVYLFAVPFTGRSVYEQPLLANAGAAFTGGFEAAWGVRLPVHDLFVVPLAVGSAVLFLTGVLIVRNRARLEVQVMTLALVTVTLLSNLCSVNGVGGPRYYFIPSLILLTLLLVSRPPARLRVVHLAVAILVAATLVGNGTEFRSVMGRQAYDPAYPDWQSELQLWRTSPSYQLHIWPTPWTMNLELS
jgi:hypothetical protein